MTTVRILYFSDVLCVWAYIAQLRVNFMKETYGDRIRLETRFCSVFADTARKITAAWSGKGEYEGFNAHLRHAAAAFPEVKLNQNLWLTVRPASSTAAHLFLKAAQLSETSGACAAGTTDQVTWALRCAFFEEARDIARWDVQCDIGRQNGVDVAQVEALIHDGSAFAALASDYQDADAMGIQGSPSFVLNDGRQKLYGNVGYRILDANIQELLREPQAGQASWC
jgi:predicted DsbA family dithiol-disulfide isomerase